MGGMLETFYNYCDYCTQFVRCSRCNLLNVLQTNSVLIPASWIPLLIVPLCSQKKFFCLAEKALVNFTDNGISNLTRYLKQYNKVKRNSV